MNWEKFKIIGLYAFTVILISCTGVDSVPVHQEIIPANEQLIPDGRYKLTAYVLENEVGEILTQLSRQSASFVYYRWLGKGKFMEIVSGYMVIDHYLPNWGRYRVDYSCPDITEITLDKDSTVIRYEILHHGCFAEEVPEVTFDDTKFVLIENGIIQISEFTTSEGEKFTAKYTSLKE